MNRKGDIIPIKGHPEMEPRVRLEDGSLAAMCALSDAKTLREYGLEAMATKEGPIIRHITNA